MKKNFLLIGQLVLFGSILSLSARAQTTAYLPLVEVDSDCSNVCNLVNSITHTYHVTTCTDSIDIFYDKNNQPVTRILASYDPSEKRGDSIYQLYINNTWVDTTDFQESYQDNGCYFSYRIYRGFNGIKWDTTEYAKTTIVLNNAGNISKATDSTTFSRQLTFLSTHTYHYDINNKLIGIDYYFYNPKGQLLGVSRDTNLLFNNYDGTCNLQFTYTETQLKDTVTNSWTAYAKTYYTYNSSNQLTSVINFNLDAGGLYDTTSYSLESYDSHGNPLSITSGVKSNNQWYTSTNSYLYTYGPNNEILRKVISYFGVPEGYIDFSNFIPCSGSTSGVPNAPPVHTGLTIYPDPAASSIEIKTASEFADGTAIVYDAMGQALEKFNLIQAKDFRLDIHDLLPGVYLLILRTSYKTVSGKFIKQ